MFFLTKVSINPVHPGIKNCGSMLKFMCFFYEDFIVDKSFIPLLIGKKVEVNLFFKSKPAIFALINQVLPLSLFRISVYLN